ncbi:MAG: Zn-dependent hydrolase [Cyanobacteria bacterium]|jgi:L-ascorbate metabolism protein UlaG (beta-lactamase superfamily)|nr:Zn-dependent hydrolase [Cyanobacteria bacterium GSL.Bin21]
MKRRQVIQYIGLGALTTVGSIFLSPQAYQAQTSPQIEITWLGHTAFLFSSDEFRVLVNPFKPIGCTAGYAAPEVNADLVMISSQLFDEGGGVANLPNNPRVLFEPGLYEFQGQEIQGISMPHDREGGRRFGINIAWSWQQGGLKILHLGGAAAPLEFDQKILMGKPDIVIIPVGGGPKAYTPELAKQAMETLQPKLVIPSHYRTTAADEDACDLVGIEEFTKLLEPGSFETLDRNQITLTPNALPEQMQVKIMSSDGLIVKS